MIRQPRAKSVISSEIFDPLRYGVITGGKTGNPALDITIAQTNRAACQAAADQFVAKVKSGFRDAAFVFPRPDFLMCAVPRVGANWVVPLTGGWSHHGIVFDFGVWTLDQEVIGGRIIGEGGRIIRIENDPLDGDDYDPDDEDAEPSNSGANNSTILVCGPSRGLRVQGVTYLEGFQVDSQSEGLRGPTSGDGWQFSFGVQSFTAEHLHGWKGSNSGAAFNLNKRGQGSTPGNPLGGYDMSANAMVRDFEVEQITSINGEHGGLLNSCEDFRIWRWDVSALPYDYKGVPQRPFLQRGLYTLCARGRVDYFACSASHHVGLHLSLREAGRTSGNMDMSFGTVDVSLPFTNLDVDGDRYESFEMVNNNTGVGDLRTIAVHIEELRSRDMKAAVVWREADAMIDETTPVLTSLRIDKVDTGNGSLGIYVRPRAGAGEIIIGSGDSNVYFGASKQVNTPNSGMTIQQATLWGKATAAQIPIFYSQLLAYNYGTTGRNGDISPGTVKCVVNWPGAASAPVGPVLALLGTASATTSGSSLAVGSINAVVGDMLQVGVTCDNAGTSGASPLSSGAISDSAGNVWTNRELENNTQGGASNDGVTFGIWECVVTNTMTNATITAAFSPNVTARTMGVRKLLSGGGLAISYASSGAVQGRGTTLSSGDIAVTAGQTVMIWGAAETNSTIPSDPAWTDAQFVRADTGTGTGSVAMRSQQFTATEDGNLSYSVSLGATLDWCVGWVVIDVIGTPEYVIYDDRPIHTPYYENWRPVEPTSRIETVTVGGPTNIGSQALPGRFHGIDVLNFEDTVTFTRMSGGTDPTILTIDDVGTQNGTPVEVLVP